MVTPAIGWWVRMPKPPAFPATTNHRSGGAVERADAGAVSAGEGRPMKRSIAYDSDPGGRRTHWVDCCGSVDSSPRLLLGFLMRCSFRLLTMMWLVAAGPLQAQDLTVFGGVQHPGTLTLRSGVDGIGSTVGVQPGASPGEFQIDPTTFGTFGIRLYNSAAPLGLEHTVAYSPKFLDTGGRAFLYSTNLRMEFSTGSIPALRHRWWGPLLWRWRRDCQLRIEIQF